MRSYKQRPPDGRYDVIFIGSGLGCLAAASALAQAGERVLVLERHWVLGGFTQTFRRPGLGGGWEWDVGVHYVGMAAEDELLGQVLALVSDGSLRFARIEGTYDRMVVGDESWDFVAPAEALLQSLAPRFPSRLAELRRHVRLLEHLGRLSSAWLVDAALPPGYRRRAGAGRTRAVASQNLGRLLARRLRDERLLGVLTGQWGDWGLPPGRSALQAFAAGGHYLAGAHYPIGGSGRLAESVVAALEARGGEVARRAEVQSILIQRGRAAGVRMADGRELRSSVVVAGGGVHATARLLSPADAACALGPALDLPASHGHISLYLGLEGTAGELGLEATNTWVFPGFDHDAAFDRFLADPSAPLPSLFFSSPAAKDPSYPSRFPGRAALEIVAAAPADLFGRYSSTRWRQRGAAYEDEKAALAERLLTEAYRQLPHLRGRVRHVELSTPLTTRDLGGAPTGASYGLAHTPERFARVLRATTPIAGLFLTGQDLTTCGVTASLVSGLLTASAILRRPLLPMPR